MTVLRRAVFTGEESFDLLVIGGGITGAALAYEAASRGWRVALIEQGDFGAATSAATGKLIHGGLRYLKNFELGLVRESLAERRNLMRIAPNLVCPLPIVLPDPGVVEHAGLTAYDVLSFDRNRLPDRAKHIPGHRGLSRAELADLGLGHLRGAMVYHDAMMLSPERLTLAFVRSAHANGAEVANYVWADRLLVSGGRVLGAAVTDLETGAELELRAAITVNATGAWAHDLLASTPATADLAGPAPRVRSEGIYLVTRKLTDVMVLTVQRHGHFSFAPWRGHSLIGPTETPYHGPVSQWRVTLPAIEALLAGIAADNTARLKVGIEDVVAAYGGLRPLTESGGDDTYNASRASELIDHAEAGVTGFVSAMGGKYTTSRAFASGIVDRLAERSGRSVAASRTAVTPLDGCDLPDFEAARIGDLARAERLGLAADTADLLTRHYGTASREVLALASGDERLRVRATPDGEPLAAVTYAARNEMPQHLTDILLRRTGIGLLGDPGEPVLAAAAAIAAGELGWDEPRAAAELAAARKAVRLPEN